MTQYLKIGFLIAVFSFLGACAPRYIYVDQSNTAGPWDGSLENPFLTVQEGLNAAEKEAHNVVVVKSGTYQENLLTKRGTRLRADGYVLLTSDLPNPVVVAFGNNRIKGFRIEGAIGVRFPLESGLTDELETEILIQDCKIRGSSRGVEVTGPVGIPVEAGVTKRARIRLYHNWILNSVGNGLTVEMNQPTDGEIQISLDIKDNVFQNTFGLGFKGNGSSVSYAGWVFNNLIFDGGNGISLHGWNGASIGSDLQNNTIANNNYHAIIASADSGPLGFGHVHPSVVNNIISGNVHGSGYEESGSHTSAFSLANNLFFNNQTHYYDNETDSLINDVAGLNTPIVNGQVIYFTGGNNAVGNPLFEAGSFPWQGIISFEGPHAFFLKQNGQTSPAVDAGNLPVNNVKDLDERSTKTNFDKDTGIVDVGFHYQEE